ncbi:1-acyl-sn-glycerol-3-phosphate-acyltransferase [Roridomyces roridus]|uniref:1-acyl-sn-glycerol-3-phosphate acyltransferase n=1 Tax=Roridomyces roridus TaxID=1738132 RepID=A0AAD7CK67_9AGAR|nr:1-acyl-sn-glycerol-3-phosphate-acyltransferase [Roridomyces roridus]
MSRLAYARTAAYFGAIGIWGLVTIPLSLALTLLGRRFESAPWIMWSFYHIIRFSFGICVDIEGSEHLETAQPAVLMLNHQSALDIWFLGCVIPKRVCVMVKKSLGFSAIGPTLYLTGSLFVERGTGTRAIASFRRASATLREQRVSLLVFPEGTRNRSPTASLLPFKKGAFHMAVQSGLPIVPVVCENYSHIYRAGCFEPGIIKARVLPPIPTAGLGEEDVQALTTRVREQMLQVLLDISR